MSWVPVALKKDVPAGVVIPSRVGGTDLAIWCASSGAYHAWSDRCPHRGMRLSHGFVRGDRLACIYHGWQYDAAGSCTYIPAHPRLTPPDAICVPTYDCIAAGEVIWVALDTPSDPPPALAGRQPVRSLQVHRSAGDVAAHFGAADAMLVKAGSDFELALALQPGTESTCMVHALAGSGADRKAVSRWLEELRVELEGASA